MVDIDAEVAPLRAEVERLRRLVGPCEQSYDDLRADLLAARDAAKSAEQAAGELRGELTEAYAALDRALVGAPAFAHLLRQVKNPLSGTFVGPRLPHRRRVRRRLATRLGAGPASAEPHGDRSASSLLRPDARLRPRARAPPDVPGVGAGANVRRLGARGRRRRLDRRVGRPDARRGGRRGPACAGAPPPSPRWPSPPCRDALAASCR